MRCLNGAPSALSFNAISIDLILISIVFVQDFDEEVLSAKPLIYSHFSSGVGEPRYLACSTWESLSKILTETLDGYNEVNAAMNLVLFEDAMAHVYVYLKCIAISYWLVMRCTRFMT